MFKKILIIEDIDSINFGITAVLEKNFPVEVHCSKYCDDGLLKVKKANQDNASFDLIITDLSFKEDYREAKITTGEELINAINHEQPDIKIIVYSVEDKLFLIKSLFESKKIKAFVAKGRESSSELLDAIAALYNGDTYISPQFSNVFKEQLFLELDKYDVEVLRMLSEGFTQEDISKIFKQKAFPSASTSSIEKRINKLKFFFKAHNSIHLVAITKDLRLI